MENINEINVKLKKRIWELDFIRGFLILLMVVDHLMITVAFFFGPEWFKFAGGAENGFTKFFQASTFYYYHDARAVIQPIVVMTFIALCGLSTGFSRNNLKRGCQLGLVALLISAATRATGDDSLFISFGIIHMLASGIIVWAVISAVTRNNKHANLIIGIAITMIIAGLYFGAQSSDAVKYKIADCLYFLIETEESFDMSRGDFYPLIPWAGVFFLAAGLSPYLYPDKTSHLKRLDGKWNKPLCFFGRHTLIVYVFHVLVIIVVLEIISYLFATKGVWLFTDFLNFQ